MSAPANKVGVITAEERYTFHRSGADKAFATGHGAACTGHAAAAHAALREFAGQIGVSTDEAASIIRRKARHV